MIRVLVADDHAMFRAGLKVLLGMEEDIEVVGEAATGEQATVMARELAPDVVVMDIQMPVMDGIEATRLITAECPEVRVLILSMYDDEEHVRQLLGAGASGFLIKEGTSQELIQALREVVAGGLPMSPGVAARAVRDYARRVRADQDPSATGALTVREREVLTLVAEGQTSQAIADQLGLSRKTVEVHRTNLMRKLGLHDVTDLVKYALRNGLISLDS
jgi:two-component system, NarL family, response regulator NreC